jgi:hypothetical protein
MIFGLEEIKARSANAIDQPVLLRDPARPAACEQILEWLRLANPNKWITKGGLYQVENPQCDALIAFNPGPEIFAEFRRKYGLIPNATWQDPSPGAAHPGTRVSLSSGRHAAKP